MLVPAGILLAQSAGDFPAFLSDFLFYVVFSALTTMMMTKVMYASQALTEAQDAVMRLEGILGAPLMHEVAPDRAKEPAGNSIEFDHVSFTYPTADAPALRDVTLSVPAGATVALVGALGRRQDHGGPASCRASGTWARARCASGMWTCATSRSAR